MRNCQLFKLSHTRLHGKYKITIKYICHWYKYNDLSCTFGIFKKSNIMVATSAAQSRLPSREPEFTFDIYWVRYVIFSFLCSILWTIICLFVHFLFDVALSCPSKIYIFWLLSWYLQTFLVLWLARSSTIIVSFSHCFQTYISKVDQILNE
jgi:hypothetical protein